MYSRVVHVSVQLLSPQDLAIQMVHKHNLLHIMCTCLRHVIEGCLTTCGLHRKLAIGSKARHRIA